MTQQPHGPQRPTRRRVYVITFVALGALLLLSSCAAGPNTAQGAIGDRAGFWLGIWHGIIFPVTFVISMFTDTVNMYEVNNNGNWYDFGFFIGVTALGGAGSRARKRS